MARLQIYRLDPRCLDNGAGSGTQVSKIRNLLVAVALVLGLTARLSAQAPPKSTFFSTAAEESYSTYELPGDGDLWPSCWATDGNLYAANGDGMAFDPYEKPLDFNKRYDMAVSRIEGVPPHLSGTTIARDIGTDWSGPKYNRKPTGMLCIGGAIYLAFQNLAKSNFNDAPAASIAKSVDDGKTWTWDASAPMFGDPENPSSAKAHKFTTIFFLDFGRDSRNSIDKYVYAYGLDNNWRAQQALYLARVPNDRIQTRSAWEFYAGVDDRGDPRWTRDITGKKAVLEDDRLLYADGSGKRCPVNQSVIGQGGVVYDKPLQRYIFTSWSCATHQMYEAPEPWGPWKLFLSKDFGPFFTAHNYGEYGTNIPSKFISQDGKTLYLQSNLWVRAYTFSLRKVYLEPFKPGVPSNGPSPNDLALMPGTRALSKSTRFGSLCGLNCSDALSGSGASSEDDFDGEPKTTDWWGYEWPAPYKFNEVVYETGSLSPEGGWFAGTPRVQIYRDFRWMDVGEVSVRPPYPGSMAAGDHLRYTFKFPFTWGYGVRIIGVPGGGNHYTSISRLGVYYSAEN